MGQECRHQGNEYPDDDIAQRGSCAARYFVSGNKPFEISGQNLHDDPLQEALYSWTLTIYTSRRRFSSKRIDAWADERHSSDNMDELSHTVRPLARINGLPGGQTGTGLGRNALVEYRDR